MPNETSLRPVCEVLVREANALHMLATLISGGVPILDSLKLVAGSQKEVNSAFIAIHDSVREGGAVYAPMTEHPDVFSGFTAFLVHVGEEVGGLDQALFEVARLSLRLSKLIELEMAPDTDRILIMVDFIALSHLLDSDLALITSLKFLADHSPSKNQETWGQVNGRVEKGDSLSVAMAQHGTTFPAYAIKLIEAGEASGTLDVVIGLLAEYIVFKVMSMDYVSRATS